MGISPGWLFDISIKLPAKGSEQKGDPALDLILLLGLARKHNFIGFFLAYFQIGNLLRANIF